MTKNSNKQTKNLREIMEEENQTPQPPQTKQLRKGQNEGKYANKIWKNFINGYPVYFLLWYFTESH